MPRGGGSSSSRPGKKRVRHPGLTIERDDSPMPSYRQQTLPPTHDLSIVASRTVTDSQGGQSTSGSGGDGFLHPSRMTSSRRSAPVSVEPAGSDDGSDTESDAGGDDVSAARVRGSGCPLEPLAPGEKLRCSIVQGKLEGKGVSHFFLKQIKCQTISFWPYYSKVLKSVKEGIWNSFLARYYIVGGTDVQAKILFESDSHKKWKNFLTKQKKKCLASVNNDYARLREAPRLRWCTQEDSWEEYLEHWLSEDQKKIAEQASRNRLCSAGRPEGQISVHPYRNDRRSFVRGNTYLDMPQEERLDGCELFEIVNTLDADVFGKNPSAQHRTAGYGLTHNWCKKSIFWELSYWPTNKIRHNIDFMHTEKNNGENVIHTVFDVPGKTKDSERSRIDIEAHCARPELHMVNMVGGRKAKPKAAYTLSKEQQKEVRNWLSRLQLPDGYASNIARCAGNVNFTGLKSHDIHIIVERLFPVALRHLLPNPIWETITEWCCFFRDISATTLNVEHVEKLGRNIIEIICKMEKIFPPAFFDVMEHLPIHLPYEALYGGPVQYRWMYPFESFLGGLKKLVRQKAHVEGSICEAYLVKEVSNFCSLYFEEGIQTNITRARRHDVPNQPEDPTRLALFRYPGRGTFVVKHRYFMDEKEYNTAHVYILCNTPEVNEYLESFRNMLEELYPDSTEDQIDREVTNNFGRWFRNHVATESANASLLNTLSMGPAPEIKRFKGYYVNGYYFDIRQGDRNKSNYNSGVCVKGSSYGDGNHVDYYGVIEEIWELTYGYEYDKVVLFKCFWFDIRKWMRVHPRNGMVEVKHKSRASKDDPFILASQAQQVYYLRYVSTGREHKQWWVAMKSNARSRIDWTHMQNVDVLNLNIEDIFQEEEQPPPVQVAHENYVNIVEEGIFVVLEEGTDDDEEELNDGSEYESDYPDDNDDSEEDFFGNNDENEDDSDQDYV